MNVASSSFRVYYSPPCAPTSGHRDDDDDDESGPVVFVCHHGAGYSAMSFALLAWAIQKESQGRAGVLSLDARGHGEPHILATIEGSSAILHIGKSVCREEHIMDIETLADDLLAVLKEVFPDKGKCPNLILVGHSMVAQIHLHLCNCVLSAEYAHW